MGLRGVLLGGLLETRSGDRGGRFAVYALSWGRDGPIPAGIIWAILLLDWACAARFRRIVALRVNSVGITVRERPWERRTTTVPWDDVGYLVIWHDERDTSLSVQPLGGTKQPMRLDGWSGRPTISPSGPGPRTSSGCCRP